MASTTHPRTGSRILLLLAVVPACLLTARQTAWIGPYLADDAFVALRYAQRWITGQGLTWTDGDRVEGYGNLLWITALAGMGKLGFDLVFAARFLGASCTVLAYLALAAAARPRDLASTLRAAAPPLLVAAAAPTATWTTGGLEGPLALLLLALGCTRVLAAAGDPEPTSSALRRAAWPLALLCWTRPEGPLWVLAFAMVLGAQGLRAGFGEAIRRAFALATLPVAAVLAQHGFRVLYYADVVPNAAHFRFDPELAVRSQGLAYVGHGALALVGILAPALLGAAAASLRAERRTAALAMLLGALGWSAAMVALGGELAPGYRLWQPALAPLALLSGLLLEALPASRAGLALGALVALGGAAANGYFARTDWRSALAHDDASWRTARTAGEALRTAFADERPTLAVDAAGALPFFAKLPALDMRGRCDRRIALSPVPPVVEAGIRQGRRLVGTSLRGNGSYVLDEAVDLAVFADAPWSLLPVYPTGLDLETDPRWLADYRCVALETAPGDARPSVRLPLWVRVDGRAGVQRATDRITVPAFLLGAWRQPQAFRFGFDPPAQGSPEEAWLQRSLAWLAGERQVAAVPAADGELELDVRGDQPAELQLRVPPGKWRLVPDRPVSVDLELRGDHVRGDAGAFTLTGKGPTAVALVLTPRPGSKYPLRLRTIALQRLP